MVDKTRIEIEAVNWGESGSLGDIAHSVINHVSIFFEIVS